MTIPLTNLRVVYDSPAQTRPAAIVGGDTALSDGDDATYVEMFHRQPTLGGTESSIVLADFAPVAITPDTVFALRASATLYEGSVEARYGIDLHEPGGGAPGTDAILGATTIVLPVADGTPQDVMLAFEDWYTGDPATFDQLATYFAGGGTVRLTFSAGGTPPRSGMIRYHELFYAGVLDEPVTYRRIFPRDDGLGGGAPRNYPRSKGTQSGNRIGGGYL